MIARPDSQQIGEKLLERQVETFYRVNRFINSIDNLEELLNLIMEEAAAAVGAEASCIALYDPQAQNLRIAFASGEKAAQARNVTLPLGQGVLGQVALSRQPLRVDDVSQDARFDPSVDRKTGFRTRCLLAAPLLRRQELLGALEVVNKRDAPCFTEEDTRLLEVVANQAALAIENARLFERSLRQERLSVIGRLAASIIHDLKAPITVIRGMAEIVTLEDLPPDKLRRFSGMIVGEAERLTEMVQELLDYSRGNLALRLRETEIGPWLREATAPLAARFEQKGLRLELKLGYAGPARIDPERLRRAVVNLAGNAGDALSPGGWCMVETRLDGSQWELAVSDNGKGIPPELRGRVFEPFFTHGKDKGTGLGLAIVQEIAVGHGGAITMTSRVAGEEGDGAPGTTFRLRLPLNGEAAV